VSFSPTHAADGAALETPGSAGLEATDRSGPNRRSHDPLHRGGSVSIGVIESRRPGRHERNPGPGQLRDGRADREIRCRVARSRIERTACARLRADVYVWERKWIRPTQLVDGLEVDGDDARSVHLLASRDGELVGTARLILPRARQPLPVDSLLTEARPSGRSGGEVSRLAVARHARGDSAVMMVLVRGLYETAVEHGIDDFYAIIEEPFHRYLTRLGLPFRPIGASRWIYRSWNLPVRLEVARVGAAVAAFYSQRDHTSQVIGGVA
jgi:N-acyl-L-homoserine lactone synthetase